MRARMQMHDDVLSENAFANASENTSAPAQPSNQPETSEGKHSLLSLLFTIAIILAIAFGIRLLLVEPYLVEGASMENTFHSYDYLMVEKISYRFHEPQRGDVVVLRFPLDESRSFIKRIIGLPGETVEMHGRTVTIINDAHPDGLVLDEPYISEEHQSNTELSITLGENEYFVLGDNRAESADSRYWGILPRKDIVGEPLVRLYPFNQLALFPGEARYSEEAVAITNQ